LTRESPRYEQTLRLPLDPDWRGSRLGVAALLQDPKTLAIGGAAVAR
jgi:hypothetical protein